MAIVKANNLIETSYRLGSREQFFILFLISKIDSIHDMELRSFQIHYQDIAKILNFDGKRRVANRSDIFKLMDNLNRERIRFENDEIEGQAVWISSMERNKKTDIFTITIDPKLKPYLIQLKEQFTKYNIQNIVNLNSHAVRMYEILKRYEYEGSVVLHIEDQLKTWLGVKNKYKEYYEFKRWVIVDSQRQLKKYTDIAFTFEPYRKEGRRIISLQFTIFKNDPTHIPKSLEGLNKVTMASNLLTSSRTKKNASPTLKQESPTHQKKLAILSQHQKNAYDFLKEKNVNKAFVIDQILLHPQVQYEPLQGFEDVYVRIVWNFFKRKTNSKNLAPTFVTWWKKGRLTEAGLHSKFVEDVILRKNQLTAAERTLRLATKGMNPTAYADYQQQLKNAPTQTPIDLTSLPSKKMPRHKKQLLDIVAFQKKYPTVYQGFYEKVVIEFEKQYAEAGITFDKKKFEQSILNNTATKCEEWLRKQA